MTRDEAEALGWRIWSSELVDERQLRYAGREDDNDNELWLSEKMTPSGPVRNSARTLEQALEQIEGYEAHRANRKPAGWELERQRPEEPRLPAVPESVTPAPKPEATRPAPKVVPIRTIRPGGH